MIIRKKNNNIAKQSTEQKKDKEKENVGSTSSVEVVKQEEVVVQKETLFEKDVETLDINKIDFSQRAERRRGDRRRGYRRIDDRNLVSRAQEEATFIKDNAAKEGFQIGLKNAEEEILKLKEQLEAFLDAQNQVYEKLLPDVLDIAIAIAEKIVQKEVSLDETTLINIVVNILKETVKKENRVEVYVNNNDVENLEKNMSQILAKSHIDAKISIQEDDTIEEGSCIVKTSNGIIDAKFSTQFQIIKEMFKTI